MEVDGIFADRDLERPADDSVYLWDRRLPRSVKRAVGWAFGEEEVVLLARVSGFLPEIPDVELDRHRPLLGPASLPHRRATDWRDCDLGREDPVRARERP